MNYKQAIQKVVAAKESEKIAEGWLEKPNTNHLYRAHFAIARISLASLEWFEAIMALFSEEEK